MSHSLYQDLVSVDLLSSWLRSEHKQAGATEEDAQRAIVNYRKWLLLVAENPALQYAPTREIDEIWHLHMLSPVAYCNDCMALFGFVLDHDGGFGKMEHEEPVLMAVFERTAAMWLAKYGEPYSTTGSGTDVTKCWHDCVSRCWHACKSLEQDMQLGVAHSKPASALDLIQ